MHKLAKGLKKKKKQKKDKKGEDEEEFDAEELERYRRERAGALQKSTESSESSSNQLTKTIIAGNDEWKKFQALTSGIDSILKKTQNDLDRIKSTSFFQRKVPEPEPDPEEDPEVQAKKKELAKRYVGFDKVGNPIEQKSDSEEENKKKTPFIINQDGFIDISDNQEEHDDSAEEDIFDTTYIDVLQNIDVQLAYIPDSPTEDQLGDDPFDTTNADKVLKTVDKTGKKLVSLGNAVEVLSGRIDHVSTRKVSKNRQQSKNPDLLGDFNEDNTIILNKSEKVDIESLKIEKTLLDDDSNFPNISIDLTKVPTILPKCVTAANIQEEPDENKILDISEFEILKDKTLLDEIPVLDEEEFNLDTSNNSVILNETEDPFAEKESGKVIFHEEIIEVSFEVATFVDEKDPFDTTIADNILPSKVELKLIEKELEEFPVSEVSISLTDPSGSHRDYETGLLNGQKQSSSSILNKDLLAGSIEELNQLIEKPIKPVEELSYVDPFDTSEIKELPPGKTELKVLEKELLGDKNHSLESIEDEEFNPRKEELIFQQEKESLRSLTIFNKVIPDIEHEVVNIDIEITEQKENKEKKSSILNTFDTDLKVVASELLISSKKLDFFAWNEEEKSLSNSSLTPYHLQKSLDKSEDNLQFDGQLDETDFDPFDTSFVVNTVPGKTELKLIESELLRDQQINDTPHSFSNHEFDGRSKQVLKSEPIVEKLSIIKSSEVIESLINKTKELHKRQDSILDTDVNVSTAPLFPNVKYNTIEEVELSYKDPFDTSYASNILPGKAELKLLENELRQVSDTVSIRTHPVIELVNKKITLEKDTDFYPRIEKLKEKDILCSDTQEISSDKVLTPTQETDLYVEDTDPFDTSFAKIDPGKTELRLIESELINK